MKLSHNRIHGLLTAGLFLITLSLAFTGNNPSTPSSSVKAVAPQETAVDLLASDPVIQAFSVDVTVPANQTAGMKPVTLAHALTHGIPTCAATNQWGGMFYANAQMFSNDQVSVTVTAVVPPAATLDVTVYCHVTEQTQSPASDTAEGK